MALKHVNAVIVGSGAGGGAVAKELSEAGLTVVVLERGKWMNEGSKIVRVGTERRRFVRSHFSSFCMSFALSIIAIATMKLLHSKIMLVELCMRIPSPYQVDVIGKSI